MSQRAYPAEPSQQILSNLARLATGGEHLMDASVDTWTAETRAFFLDLIRDNYEATRGLAQCRTPSDVLEVSQKWWAARFKAAVEAGLRVVLGALHEPETAAAEAAAFHLPE